MPVRRAQAEISSTEFVEWIAISQIDPFSCEREGIYLAALRMDIAAACGAKNLKLDDFIIRFNRETKIQTAEHLEAMFAAIYGSKQKDENK